MSQELKNSVYWSELVKQLDPYVPGEQPREEGLIKLNTNENPYPPSPEVIKVVTEDTVNQLRLYPDPSSSKLRSAIANQCGVDRENVFVGNGSDEVLALTFMTFFKQQLPLLYPDISYSFYPVYCKLFEIESLEIPLREDFSLDLGAYQQPNGGIIFANPNAPTSIAIDVDAIEALLQANTQSVVVVDEAYIDFGGKSAIGLTSRYANLLVIQTLSKSRSLAGLRIGFAVGNPALIEGLNRVKNSFNSYPIDRIAEAAAIASINDREYFEECNRRIIATREDTCDKLRLLGFEILPSSANFIFAKPTAMSAKALFEKLREQGILVRYFDKPRIGEYLRISIGTEEEMAVMVSKLHTIIN